jgi:uncharacterized glyoxalase superfamily protein PhnB
MAVNYRPEGYHTATPYLVVPGVAKLIDFLKQAFGAEERERMAQPDGRIMHAEVKIGDSIIMMGEPTPEMMEQIPAMIYLYVPDADATYQKALRAGAKSVMEPADQFYGDRSGAVEDPSGNKWWIATRKEELSQEEIGRRAEAATKKRHGA